MIDMSTAKIFILFGIVVCVLTLPLIYMYIWSPATLGHYTGLAENIIVDLPAAYAIALVLDFTFRRRQERAIEKVARVALSEASVLVNRIADLFASMIKASSTGFIPSKMEELFGITATQLISQHLDLNRNAPVTPSMSWYEYLGRECSWLLGELTSVQARYQAFLPSETSVAILKLRNNVLLDIFQNLPRIAQTYKQIQN